MITCFLSDSSRGQWYRLTASFGAYFAVSRCCHMTQLCASVKNENMISGPDFAQDSEYELQMSVAAVFQEIFSKKTLRNRYLPLDGHTPTSLIIRTDLLLAR